MSYSYAVTERRRRSAQGGYGSSSNRSTFGYWVPLALTVTAATVGIAAWIWSERKEDVEDSSSDEYHPTGIRPPGGHSGGGPIPGSAPVGYQGAQGPFPGPPHQGGPQGPSGFVAGQSGGPPAGYPGDGASRSVTTEGLEGAGFVARVSSALGMRSAPSPAQAYEWGSKTLSAGVAAAGAAVGGALGAIREGEKDGFEDHDRWSEEADKRDGEKEIKMGITRKGTADEFFSGSIELPKDTSLSQRKRKSIAIVVSAVELDAHSSDEIGQHASILSHLPDHVNLDATRVFVLIYAPYLKTTASSRLVHMPDNYLQPLRGGSIFAPRQPSSNPESKRPSQSMASSFSNISHADINTPAHTPGEFPGDEVLTTVDPKPIDETTTLYKTLYSQALMLVEKETLILPFTSSGGHKHLLRSLAPEVVYIQESLCGSDGETVADLSGWVRQTVVVIGDEGGAGGLVDTDDESAGRKGSTWWQKEERTGLGKRVAVVESLKIGDDWRRRVNEQD